ncbi:hypothetical protein OE88DRAFT_1737949 [Heliocybe sulcata]|uniref:Uncharacterized protein n=1 Tax=Heliocybe sulcata TaxID=5364 RepID=A0A5C3MWX7_9AGAM|nr:hypothetical protein OE88DRAFT_1737949 [Heliocybe sulcata]
MAEFESPDARDRVAYARAAASEPDITSASVDAHSLPVMATATITTTPAMTKMLAATVEESREKRIQKQQSRYRDRGGIFVPQTENPLIDILLTGKFLGSPKKKSAKEQGSKTPSRRKSTAVPKGSRAEASSSKTVTVGIARGKSSPRKRAGRASKGDSDEVVDAAGSASNKQVTTSRKSGSKATLKDTVQVASKPKPTSRRKSTAPPPVQHDDSSDDDIPLDKLAKSASNKESSHATTDGSNLEDQSRPGRTKKQAAAGMKATSSKPAVAQSATSLNMNASDAAAHGKEAGKPRGKPSSKGKGKQKALEDRDETQLHDRSFPKPSKARQRATKGKGKKKEAADDDDVVLAESAKLQRPSTKGRENKAVPEENGDEDEPAPLKSAPRKRARAAAKRSKSQEIEPDMDAEGVKPSRWARGRTKANGREDEGSDATTTAKTGPTKAELSRKPIVTPLEQARAKAVASDDEDSPPPMPRKRRAHVVLSDIEEEEEEPTIPPVPCAPLNVARKKRRVEEEEILVADPGRQSSRTDQAKLGKDQVRGRGHVAVAEEPSSKDVPPAIQTTARQVDASGSSKGPKSKDSPMSAEPPKDPKAKSSLSKQRLEDTSKPAAKKRTRVREDEQDDSARKRVKVTRRREALAPVTVLPTAGEEKEEKSKATSAGGSKESKATSAGGSKESKPASARGTRGEKENSSYRARPRTKPKFPDVKRGPPQSVLDALKAKRMSSPVMDSDVDPIDFLS